MQLSQETLSKINYSENRFLIDWFSFSSRIDSFESFRKLLGLDHVNWIQRSYSVQGYTNTYYFEGISIHDAGCGGYRFRGTDNEQEVKGAWLEMSGSGCRAFETWGHGDWSKLFDYVVFNAENITTNRLDIAYDDFLGYLDIRKIAEDTEKFNFVSKFRSNPEIIKSIGINDTAITVTHGRMKSDTFIRIYDKRLEQNAQEFTDHWVRNEIMLRHERAFSAICLLSDVYEYKKDGDKFFGELVSEKRPLNEVYMLIMNNYLRFIQPSDTDTNKWRAPLADHWKTFATIVTTYRVSLWSIEKSDYNVSRLDHFVENMVSSAIFTYITVHGVDKLLDVCNKKQDILAPKYKYLIDNSMDQSSSTDADADIDDIIDFGYSKPQKLYTCICCRNVFPASDMISYNNSSLVGQCRDCYHLYGGVTS